MTGACKSLLAAAALSLLPGKAFAPPFTIDSSTIDGGGGTSSGGRFTVTGTIGQPDASDMRGGAFSVAGGFWGFIGLRQTPEAPLLDVSRDPNSGVITVFWPLPDEGWFLQRSSNLGAAPSPWETVPPGTYQSDGSNRFITITDPFIRDLFRLAR
jgi:hypothetical protein